ncbi:ribosomal protein S18-alanine N-acetyltransferase [Blastochloris tepida]|uniref:N-acetyltransferase GCN5 n=1 Tax=Blastochloris tepida TaxID=2233851 RepID=A0A348FWF1_9HYPH|nr:ribosomal protein S18-alanine N-acetyltransferase [Blastochloris tepida]BBF91634.1 N-acetyltransferase GCN5 [Blastochloris tepida]
MLPATIRPAHLDDLDALAALETRVFATDRLSRRSFRHFLTEDRDELLVAEQEGGVVGYALVIFRRGTALGRLYSIAVAPEAAGHGIGRALLQAAEAAAEARDCLFLRLEVREDNATAIALYRASGYRQIARVADYYEDHEPALRLEKRLLAEVAPPVEAPPYFQQTTDFTCGPACMLMALAWADRSLRPRRSLELKLWRDSTTIFMTSGPGGCDPYGLAVTLKHRGLDPEVRVSHAGPYFLDGVRSPEKKDVMRVVQEGFREEAHDLGISDSAGPLADFGAVLDGATLALVLVSGYRMYRRKEPHWVLAFGRDERHIFVHDPWLEAESRESFIAAANLPIPTAEFHRMARFGRDNLRAAVLVRKGR